MQTKRGSIQTNSGSIQTKPGSIQTKRGSIQTKRGSIQTIRDQFSRVGIKAVCSGSIQYLPVAFAAPKWSSYRTAFLRTPVSVLFGGLLAGRQRCPHAAFARLKKSSHRTAFLTH